MTSVEEHAMQKSIVIYHTRFGNTERIAKALASGMEEQGTEVNCVNIEDVQIDTPTEYDLTAIGGPTHMFGMLEPMKTFIKKLEHVDLRDKKAFWTLAFLTRKLSTYPLLTNFYLPTYLP